MSALDPAGAVEPDRLTRRAAEADPAGVPRGTVVGVDHDPAAVAAVGTIAARRRVGRIPAYRRVDHLATPVVAGHLDGG